MTEERITETRTPEGNTHTSTTVVTDRQNSGGAAKWIGLFVLVIAAIAAVLVFSRMSDSEVAKDAAIGNAAEQVGEAAGQVGDAAEGAIEKITE